MLYDLLDGMFCDVDMHMERSSSQAREHSLYSQGGLFDVAVLREEDSLGIVTHAVIDADLGPVIPEEKELIPRIGFFNFDGECFVASHGGCKEKEKEMNRGVVVDGGDKKRSEINGVKDEDRSERILSAFPITSQAQSRALQPLLQAVHGGLYAAVLIYEGNTQHQHHSLPYAEVAAKTVTTILKSVTEKSKLKSLNFSKEKKSRKSPNTELKAPKIYNFDVQVCLTFAELNRKLTDVMNSREKQYSSDEGKFAGQGHILHCVL
jgi:hypothetical protein